MFSVRTFSLNGVPIELKSDSIVCFVGPNSSGKTRALQALYHSIHQKYNPPQSVITGSAIESLVPIHENNIEAVLKGKYKIENRVLHHLGGSISLGNFASPVNEIAKGRLANFVGVFFREIPAQSRHAAVASTPQVDYSRTVPQRPLQYLFIRPDIEAKLSEVCKTLFAKELSLNPGIGSNLTLHVGPRVNPAGYGGDRSFAYSEAIKAYPTIDTEGDGFQAAIGLFSQLLSEDVGAFFVDEPDVYLHPPQSYNTARLISKERKDVQFFFATHSSRFILGLAESAPDRLILVRLRVVKNVYDYDLVDLTVFSEIKSTPILRFTNVIESIFYERAIVCEEASDCLFYGTMLENLGFGELRNSSYWIGVNGKTNLAKTVRTLNALRVPPLSICDFDILRETENQYERDLLPLVEAHGGDVASIKTCLETHIFPNVRNNSKITWNNLKQLGIDAANPFPDLHGYIDGLISDLKSINIIINRFGELESLRKPRFPCKGAEAVNSMLELDTLNDPSLGQARLFCDEFAVHLLGRQT